MSTPSNNGQDGREEGKKERKKSIISINLKGKLFGQKSPTSENSGPAGQNVENLQSPQRTTGGEASASGLEGPKSPATEKKTSSSPKWVQKVMSFGKGKGKEKATDAELPESGGSTLR